MDRATIILAEHRGVGKIYQCECGSLHIQAGPKGLDFTMPNQGLLPDTRIVDWVLETVGATAQ